METIEMGNLMILKGENRGKYPNGNSVLIKDEVCLLVDPCLSITTTERDSVIGNVDIVINSHAHEDHFAGNYLFTKANILIHEKDTAPMQSLDALLDVYEVEESEKEPTAKLLTEIFNYRPVDDIQAIVDGDVLDLGHSKVHCIHTPGHTPGHVVLYFEPDDVLFIADLDLTSFGPYYGDRYSSLEDTIQSIDKVRSIAGSLRACISSHQAGVVSTDIVSAMDRYREVIWNREKRLLEFIGEPKTFEQIINNCFIYRKKVPGLSWQFTVEKNMMSQHVDRLLSQGRATIEDDGRIRAKL